MEQIVGPIGNDPTAPSDLHTATETTMFNSVTIMAILIITFCIFYFIDFITQLFGGVSSAIGLADTSISQAFIEPVTPRMKKRRKSGTLSRESTTQDSSVISQPETTQTTQSPMPNSSMSMKDILTRSIRPGTTVPPEISPPSSLRAQAVPTQLKPYVPPNVASDRKLAGRSPNLTEPVLESRVAGPMLSKNTQTDMDRDFSRDYCDTSSVEFLCYDQLDEFHLRPKCNNLYDKNCGLPYAEDFSCDEFGEFQYEQAQAFFEYMAQFDEVRTEFSIDDISDLDKLFDEWEDAESVDPQAGVTLHAPTTSDDDITESLYDQALNIFNRIKAKKEAGAHLDILDDTTEIVTVEFRYCELGMVLKNNMYQENSTEEERLLQQESTDEDSTQGPEHSESSSKTAEMAKLLSSSEEDQSRADVDDYCGAEDLEIPRSLRLSTDENLLHSHGSLLSGSDDGLLSDNAYHTAKSLSVFSVCQSLEIRRYHHVLFTYPDPSPHKVFLTGSFFGWKMSLPMQRERNAFRLSITLPAGEHQYRFEVHRHPTTATSDPACLLHE